MSSHSASNHYRHFDKILPHGRSKSRTHCDNNAKTSLQNCYHSKNHPPFNIPPTYYNIVHVHRFTNVDTLDVIIQHFRSCQLYSIRTKSVVNSSKLSLIQIHTIPTSLPSYVLFVHLHELPSADLLIFTKIQLIFQLLFFPQNVLYSWGILQAELEHGLFCSLYSFPIDAKCINLQSEFNKWYTKAPNYCKACKPHNYQATLGSSIFCRCKSKLHHGSSKTWSLKNAILYVTSRSMEKSHISDPWNQMLDPQHSTMPSIQLERMIQHALYDCLAVTYLRLPVSQRWSLKQLRKTPIHIFLTSSTQTISYAELEDVSDDEQERKIQILLTSTDSKISMKNLSSLNHNRSEKHVQYTTPIRLKRSGKKRYRSRFCRY